MSETYHLNIIILINSSNLAKVVRKMQLITQKVVRKNVFYDIIVLKENGHV